MKFFKAPVALGTALTMAFLFIYIPFYSFINAHVTEIGINAIGAYFGFLGAAIIYLLQIDDAASNAKKNVLARHKEHLRYFMGITEDVLIYAKSQASELDKIVMAIEARPSEFYPLGFIASDAVGRLNRADNEAVFHAYSEIFEDDPERESTYRKLLAQTDMLTAQLGATKQAFEYYRTNVYERQLRIKALVERIANDTSFLLREIRQVPFLIYFTEQNPQAIDELNALMLGYVGLNARYVPFEEYFAKFIEPLKHWLRQHDELLPQRGLDLVALTKNASVALTDLKRNSQDFLQTFDSQKLRTPLASLTALLEKMNISIA